MLACSISQSVRLCWCKLQDGLQRYKEKKRGEQAWCVGTKLSICCALWCGHRPYSRERKTKHNNSTTQLPFVENKTLLTYLVKGTAGSGCRLTGRSHSLTCDALVDAANVQPGRSGGRCCTCPRRQGWSFGDFGLSLVVLLLCGFSTLGWKLQKLSNC